MNMLELETTQRLQRYITELQQFEQRFGIDSATFYQRFQAGKLGDGMNFLNGLGCTN